MLSCAEMASAAEMQNGLNIHFGKIDNNNCENIDKMKLMETMVDNSSSLMVASIKAGPFGDSGSEKLSSESENGESLEDHPFAENLDQICMICKDRLNSPRVLSCLHVFCEYCLDKLINESGDGSKADCLIECPTCGQSTKVGHSGASSLTCDYIYTNILVFSMIDEKMLACTSCKSTENAISRCNDCASFLCGGCDHAHRYMRCFENHEVVNLEDLQKSAEKVTIHKPLFCSVHTSENLKYYCFNCQIPVCNDCLIADSHKGSDHHYEGITTAEKRIRRDVENLMSEARTKMKYCDTASGNLETALRDLQNQHDMARKTIEESYKNFSKILAKCREQSMKDLQRLHSERELKIMDIMHSVEKIEEKMNIVCKFTTRVLDQANAAEFLSMKKLISSQFIHLIDNIPKCDVNYSLEFDTKFDKFEQLAQETFGKFRTESTPPSPKESTPPPTLPGISPVLINRTLTSSNSQSGLTGSVTASSPISLPTSMQSSFEGDISGLNPGFMMASSVLTPDSPPQHTMASAIPSTPATASNGIVPTPIPGFNSIASYNLNRLANLAETTQDIPDAIVSGTPNNQAQSQHIILADILSGDNHAFSNLQALAKLRLNNNEFHTDLPTNHLMARGSSPGMDTLLTDFGLPASTSPMPALQPISDDLQISTFPQLNVQGRQKATPMQIRCKFGSLGTSKGQFNSPHGFCLGVDEEIIVADTNNHRIEVFEKNGSFKFQFGAPGKEEGQLWYPRKVAVMHTNSKFVVCDRGNERSRMQIFSKNGHFMKKIAIRYIDIVAGLAVTAKGQIVAVDSVSPTVFIISEDGDLVHWFDCSDYMREPSDIAIRDNDFYVCDFKGHCVAVFKDDGTFQYRIGNEKITCFPNGIDISNAGDILIGDSHGNRFHVACYSREGILQSEFECPHVKVSRCCGLKITSEGYVVTLAKNNHHVLVLNTLYVH